MYIQHPFNPAGYRQVQLTDAVSQIVPPLDSVRVVIQPEGQSIRLRDDGIDPTAKAGLQVTANGTFVLETATKDLRLISEALTANIAPAEAVLESAPVNSDLTFTALANGPEWNGYTFETVEDAVAAANATATLESNAANSDVTFTAKAVGSAWNGYDFEIVEDAVAAANATATLDSNAANSDITFTAHATGAAWDGYDFELVADVVAAANATATLDSAAGNSGLIFTANATGAAWNGYDFEITEDVNAGANATATLDTNAANSDLTFTAPATGTSYNGHGFTLQSNGSEGITYSAPSFSINFNPGVSTANSMKIMIDANIAANPTWPQFACAVEGDGTGILEAGDAGVNATSANGVDTVVEGVTFAANTFTIHTSNGAVASDVVNMWGDVNAPIECVDWTIADEGDGSGVVDEVSYTSAGGSDEVVAEITYAANAFTIHVAAGDVASDVVNMWGDVNAPAECADWDISGLGDGSGAVDEVSDTSAGGLDAVDPSIDFAANAFTIHMLPTSTAAEVVALWGDPNAPTECADWTATGEGDGTGEIDAVSDTSANGADAVAPSIDYANESFTIHTVPLVTTAADVKTLWGTGPAECADWSCEDEGDGSGAVAADSDISANGADAIGALVNLSFYKEL